jgi:hypothetical protein
MWTFKSEKRSTVLLSQSIYIERPFPPLVEEGTLLSSSSDGGDRQEADRRSIV